MSKVGYKEMGGYKGKEDAGKEMMICGKKTWW